MSEGYGRDAEVGDIVNVTFNAVVKGVDGKILRVLVRKPSTDDRIAATFDTELYLESGSYDIKVIKRGLPTVPGSQVKEVNTAHLYTLANDGKWYRDGWGHSADSFSQDWIRIQ